ncbi:hypothetical protein D3C85_810140 [compost metagenome]
MVVIERCFSCVLSWLGYIKFRCFCYVCAMFANLRVPLRKLEGYLAPKAQTAKITKWTGTQIANKCLTVQ